ncbi:MAG: DNA-binding protein [Devosia sp.]
MPELATLEAVDAAAKELISKKLRPSADRILRITKGSKDTVLQHMRTLGIGDRKVEREATDNPIPGLLLERAKPFIAELLKTAAEQERANFTASTERYHRSMEELESALEAEESRGDTLEDDNRTLQEQLSQAVDERELGRLELDELRDKLAACELRAREAEMQVMQLEATNLALETAAAAAAGLEQRVLKAVEERLKAVATRT